MKCLPILAMSLLVVAVTAIVKEEAKEMFRNMSQKCKEQEKASDADVETMVNENYPESREGKCLVACMQEKFGIVSWFMQSFINFHQNFITDWRQEIQHGRFYVHRVNGKSNFLLKFVTKFKTNHIKNSFQAAGDDKKKLEQAEEIAEECKDVAHDDRCEQAIMIGKCMEAGAKKREMKAERK